MIMDYQQWSGQRYVSEFLSLRCSGDVLNIVSPMGKSVEKEITESMGMIKLLRNITLKEPGRYNVFDICAGNALTAVIATFLLPINQAIAIDKLPRSRNWQEVRRFTYCFQDIFEIDPRIFDQNSIIIAVHPCMKLAQKVVDLYNNSDASHLIIMPCCEGRIDQHYGFICERLGKYVGWCCELAHLCNGVMREDRGITSPKNIIITASKGL